ncbi:MAG: hypothetical protein E6G42_08835 [Actinobacteria bacterium]|nr:MAG: hypothetical protein E6G42_08835 [Actinomycetota bacterium]
MFARVLAALALLTLAGAAGPATSSAGWSRLADPPFLRSGSVRVWTGQELLVWGGYEPDGTFRADGAAYDVGLRRWRALPPAPLRGRADSGGVWTGRELLVWGGWAGHRAFADGAAYDPLSHRWRRLPHAPLGARIPAAWVWTGAELVVWGDASRLRAARDGAAYDPRLDRWRRLPRAPFALNQASAAWVAGRMVAYGALLDGGNRSRTRYARGVAYLPDRNRWQVLAPFRLSPQASTITAVGGKAVAWDYLLDAGLYDPAENRWTKLPSLPLTAAECYPTSVSVVGTVLGWYCGTGAALDPGTRRWGRVPPPEHALDLENPVAAGPEALFLGSASNGHGPELWAYRP